MASSSDPKPSKSRSEEKRKRSLLHQQDNSLDQQQQESPVPKKTKPRSTWANLDLILSLQRNDIDDERKIELASEFVNSDVNLRDRGPQPVSLPRLASFLSDWVQPLLIPREKSSVSSGHSLDCRCWAVFIFCLNNSSVAVSLNLLKSVTQVLKYNKDSPDERRLLENVLKCFELILLSNPRAFYNASMDVWKPCVVEIVGALRKSSANDGCELSNDTLPRFSHLLLEHFVNYLRFHKDPTNIFSKFVDGLLEPLLELLVLLHIRTKEGKCGQVGSSLMLVEDILSNGLFHPANIGGFFSLRSSNTEQKTWTPKGHREFFKKLGNIIAEKKAMALWGFGYLFRLFVTSAKTLRGAPLSSKNDQALAKSIETSDEHKETSKPLFEVFVQFMQPLLIECKRYSEKEFSEFEEVSEDGLLEAHGMLKSLNETLMSFIQEKIYIRTEDTSECTHYNFLKEIYDAIISISAKIYQLWLLKLDVDDDRVKKMLTLVAREIVAATGYFLEIEYKVVEDDLVIMWLIMFSYLAVHISVEDTKHSSSLISDILNLGCKLINIYNELRQVNSPLFALCKSVRLLKNFGAADVLDYSMFICSSLSTNIWVKSVGTLICSQELQAAVSNAIKSIPEGQTSGFVQQLELDVRDSLQWMRSTPIRDNVKNLTETNNLNVSMTYLDMQAELFGRLLSEIYTTVLDSLTVTSTTSISIGNSIKDLMGTVGLSFSSLVQSQSGSVDEFIFSVTGRRLYDREKSEIDNGIWMRPLSISWVFVFFFRMYVSCRSLYRQLISLMPPVSSVKAAKSMGSFFTVARESDWKDRSESMDEGYFSWIVKASISLLDLIKFHLKDFLSATGCPTLLYVTYIMALQRLCDLNRLVKGFEFLQGRDNKLSEQWKRLIMMLKQEATELTNFMIRRGKLLDCEGLYVFVQNDELGEAKPSYDAAWDLDVCSLNGSSLHISIWRLLCRNVDVWCDHAAQKYLKKFLSCLFYYSIQGVKCSGEVSMQSTKEPFIQKFTMHHVSMEFLTNIVLYEQATLRKHFTSGFVRVLEKLLAPILSHVRADITDLGSLPDWSEFLNILKKEPLIGPDDMIASIDHSSLLNPELVLSNARYVELNARESSSFTLELRTCESLLNLLSNIPKVHLDTKSFSVYAAYVLNLERLVVSNILNSCSDSFVYNPDELLRLFLSCRKVMKYLVLASLEDNSVATDSSFVSAVFASSDSILWLLKSVAEIVGLSHAFFGEKYSSYAKDVIFPLIDHTSYIFLAISEIQMNAIKGSLLNDEKFHTEYSVEIIAEILKEQARSLLVSLSSLHAIKLEEHARVLSCSRLAVTLSCFQRFLWGLISAIDSMNEDVSTPQSSRLKPACLPKLIECITSYEDIVNLCFNRDGKTDVFTDCACKLSCSEFKHYSGNHPGTNDQATRVDSSTFNHDDNINNFSVCDYDKSPLREEQKISSLDAVGVDNVFNTVHKMDLSVLQNLKGSLLHGLLKGENPQVAFTLGQFFAASAAILKIKSLFRFPKHRGSKVRYIKLAESSMHVLLGTSVLILREMAEMVGSSLDPFSFVWLDGVLTFLEVVGSSNSDLNLSEDFYTQLIDTHFRVIGKCISLQGKSATLSSHETGTSTKMLQSHNESSRDGVQLLDQVKFSINAFKSRLRILFKKFIRPTTFDLMTALQSLERALVGVQQDCSMVYEISTGHLDGGEASSMVAAGIDCLELVLDSLSGHKLVLGKILCFINALLNIILHLRNPTIFYLEKQPNFNCEVKPDSGSVILMCVEILTYIVGNDSFQIEPCHVSQCLHIPLALFSGFHKLKESLVSYKTSTLFDNQKVEPSGDTCRDIVDHKFAVELYASCCRLLYTTVKHQKRHAEHCVAVLEESVSILLNCLEMVDTDLVRRKGYFSWKKEEAIKCASFLRRIYEEIRNQKDVFVEYSSYFLSNYICTYSGFGPLETGIKREIDEALRPGVYSLIDICSKADFQRLHTSLGEGPCRSTLKSLLHDYEVNFKYKGKI